MKMMCSCESRPTHQRRPDSPMFPSVLRNTRRPVDGIVGHLSDSGPSQTRVCRQTLTTNRFAQPMLQRNQSMRGKNGTTTTRPTIHGQEEMSSLGRRLGGQGGCPLWVLHCESTAKRRSKARGAVRLNAKAELYKHHLLSVLYQQKANINTELSTVPRTIHLTESPPSHGFRSCLLLFRTLTHPKNAVPRGSHFFLCLFPGTQGEPTQCFQLKEALSPSDGFLFPTWYPSITFH